jgi:hypothetical protein
MLTICKLCICQSTILHAFGLVKTDEEEINPGHGRHKIVELVASILKLEGSSSRQLSAGASAA